MAKSIVLNAKMRRTGVCGAAETLLVDRAGRGEIPQAARHHAARRRLRDPRRCRGAGRRPPRQAGEQGRLEHRISRRDSDRRRGRRRRCRDRAYRALRLASHRRDRHRGQEDRGEIPARSRIRRSCCTMPRRNSPTAANSVSAPRSASPPGGCMRAARSASSNSPVSSIAYAAAGRRGRRLCSPRRMPAAMRVEGARFQRP